MGIDPVWVGRQASPLLRLIILASALQRFKPQVIQSAHAYVNLYAALLGRAFGASSLGALRNSLKLSQEACGRWTPSLIRAPHALLVNSHGAIDELKQCQLVSADRIWLLPNVLDLDQFDQRPPPRTDNPPTAVLVARLIKLKRVDCFLRALAVARQLEPRLRGLVVGDGPERGPLEQHARELGLHDGAVTFLGARDDVPHVLSEVSMLVLASEDEGSPNVILEAMAARLPVISTPAGDARILVHDGQTGYLVPFGDSDAMAAKMVALTHAPDRARNFGAAGRRYVEKFHSTAGLGNRLLTIYRSVAEQQRHTRLRRVLAAMPAH
jgi:glycosyltransferase involved in cell wall biosynthesis